MLSQTSGRSRLGVFDILAEQDLTPLVPLSPAVGGSTSLTTLSLSKGGMERGDVGGEVKLRQEFPLTQRVWQYQILIQLLTQRNTIDIFFGSTSWFC